MRGCASSGCSSSSAAPVVGEQAPRTNLALVQKTGSTSLVLCEALLDAGQHEVVELSFRDEIFGDAERRPMTRRPSLLAGLVGSVVVIEAVVRQIFGFAMALPMFAARRNSGADVLCEMHEKLLGVGVPRPRLGVDEIGDRLLSEIFGFVPRGVAYTSKRVARELEGEASPLLLAHLGDDRCAPTL